MVSLTLYGGVGEVGGNKILLEDSGCRLWLDFGMSFKLHGKYFSEFLQPKKFNGVLDFLQVGLLPPLPDMASFYREDYLRHSGITPGERAAYHAVFLTHAHADHSSYIHFLRPDIPIYASEITKRILFALEVTSNTGFTDYTSFTHTFQLRPRKRGEGVTRIEGKEARGPRDFRSLEGFQGLIQVGPVAVEAVPVNHSLPGACAYIVHTSAGAIVYTGDIRFHGYSGKLSREFVSRAAAAKPVALIAEGTRIEGGESLSEAQVQERVCDIVAGKSLVIVDFPVRDIERMRSFLEVARTTGRKLAISMKQAFLLQQLQGVAADAPSLEDPHLAIYVRRKDWGLITKRQEYPWEMVVQDYDPWERDFLKHSNAVTCQEISSHQSDFIVRIDFFELPDLIALRPDPGSCYIRSLTEPIDEEDIFDLKRVWNWLRLFSLQTFGVPEPLPGQERPALPPDQQKLHASGHASGEELVEMVRQINPQILIPIHCEKPELYQKHLEGSGIDVRRLEEGQEMFL